MQKRNRDEVVERAKLEAQALDALPADARLRLITLRMRDEREPERIAMIFPVPLVPDMTAETLDALQLAVISQLQPPGAIHIPIAPNHPAVAHSLDRPVQLVTPADADAMTTALAGRSGLQFLRGEDRWNIRRAAAAAGMPVESANGYTIECTEWLGRVDPFVVYRWLLTECERVDRVHGAAPRDPEGGIPGQLGVQTLLQRTLLEVARRQAQSLGMGINTIVRFWKERVPKVEHEPVRPPPPLPRPKLVGLETIVGALHEVKAAVERIGSPDDDAA